MKAIKYLGIASIFAMGLLSFHNESNALIQTNPSHTCYNLTESDREITWLAFDCADCVQKRTAGAHTGESTCTSGNGSGIGPGIQ